MAMLRNRYRPRHRRPSTARILFFLAVSLTAFMTAIIEASPFTVAPLGTRLAVCAVCAGVFFPSYTAVYR